MVEADAKNIRVDHINVHWYDYGGDPNNNINPNPVDVANRLKSYLSGVYARYRKPIWITEFNANPTRSRAIQDGFLQEIMPYLEDIGYVERYSYYQWDQGADTMTFLSPTRGQLSSTGQIYNDQPSSAAYVSGELPAGLQSADIGTANTGAAIYNGTLAASTTYSNSEWSGGDGSAIGARGGSHTGGRGSGDAGTESFEGQIAMFRGYKNQVLTPAEVAANFAAVAGAGVSVNLDGTVSDPNGDPVSVIWSLASGPGPVVFGNAHAVDTTVIMRAPGTYVLLLTADDGVGSTSQTVTVNVIELPASYLTWAAGTFAKSFTLTHPTANPDGDAFINLQEFAFGTDPTLSTSGPITYEPGYDVITPGSPVARNLAIGGVGDFHAIFGRRKDYLAAGLTCTVQFSADLEYWVDSTDTPTVLTGDNSAVEIEAVSIPFPDIIDVPTGLKKPTFFRVGVSRN